MRHGITIVDGSIADAPHANAARITTAREIANMAASVLGQYVACFFFLQILLVSFSTETACLSTANVRTVARGVCFLRVRMPACTYAVVYMSISTRVAIYALE